MHVHGLAMHQTGWAIPGEKLIAVGVLQMEPWACVVIYVRAVPPDLLQRDRACASEPIVFVLMFCRGPAPPEEPSQGIDLCRSLTFARPRHSLEQAQLALPHMWTGQCPCAAGARRVRVRSHPWCPRPLACPTLFCGIIARDGRCESLGTASLLFRLVCIAQGSWIDGNVPC